MDLAQDEATAGESITVTSEATVERGGNPPSPPLLLLVLLTLAAAAGLATLGLRLNSFATGWAVSILSKTEQSNLYAIWKLLVGHPLYEWPNRDHFVVTYYNFLYYHFYAAVLALWGAGGERLLFSARLVTLSLAVIGAICQWRVVLEMSMSSARCGFSYMVGLVSVSTWLGHASMNHFAVNVRPDIGAILLSLLGIWATWRAVQKGRIGWWIAASLMFWLAWAFKQSTIWSFCGTLLFVLLYRRRIRELAALLVPFALFCALSLAAGSDAYRFSQFVVPTLTSMRSLSKAWRVCYEVLIEGSLLWLALPVFAVLEALRRRLNRSDGAGRKGASSEGEYALRAVAWRYACCLLLVTSLGGFPILFRIGSSTNTTFESLIASSLLFSIWYSRLSVTAGRYGARVLHASIGVLALLSTLVSIGQLASADRHFSRTHRAPLVLGTREEIATRRQLFDYVRTLPKPLLSDDGILVLPWHSSQGIYPAYVVDFFTYKNAKRAGLVPPPGLVGLLDSGTIRSVIVHEGHWIIDAARRRGYEPVELPEPLAGKTCISRSPAQYEPCTILVLGASR